MTIPSIQQRDFRVDRVAAPLRQGATESIRNAIAVGRFGAGERLLERDLCQMTGVSRTLVREALRQLESEGLITVVPHRGPIVAHLAPEQAEGIYQVRKELEGLAAELFARNASDRDRDRLREALDNLEREMREADPIRRLDAKNHFYDCLIEGSGNEALGVTLRLLNSRITLLRATSLQAAGRTGKSIGELAELVQALIDRDPAKARKAAMRHVDNAAAAAIRAMRETPA